jgi:pyruvate dehydrogenase E1 component alpha subunit
MPTLEAGMKTTKRAKTATNSKSPKRGYTPTPQEIVDLYKQMLFIRRFEEHCDKAYRQDKIGGYLHLYIGQEALALGFIHHLRTEDRVLGHYRDHAYVLALGSDPRAVMAELYGKVTGLCRGKGGSMHLYDKANNFLGGYGIVGDVTGIATGVAFAQKYEETGGVTLCFFGDGGMNAGLLHESLNMAGLWKLPVIYIVENNKYAMGTPVELHSAVPNLAQRASVYGFPSKQIDGMDLLNVLDEAKAIIDHVRTHQEPYFVEAIVYRFVGHGAADITDPGSYRTREEVEEWRKRDPLTNLQQYLLAQGLATEADLKLWDEQAREQVADAARFADESPDPDPSELYMHVLAD